MFNLFKDVDGNVEISILGNLFSCLQTLKLTVLIGRDVNI